MPQACQTCRRADRPLKACLRCRCVHYCGRDCQRTDWPGHKAECEELNSALLGGEREITLPLDAAGRSEILEADVVELVGVARQSSCSSTRALSSYATALRCLRAAALPPAEAPMSAMELSEVPSSFGNCSSETALTCLSLNHAIACMFSLRMRCSAHGFSANARVPSPSRPSHSKTASP